jgi:hypothetical protein
MVEFGILETAAIPHTSSATLYEGNELTADGLVFEPPVRAAKWLYLELPCENYERTGNLHLRIDVGQLKTLQEQWRDRKPEEKPAPTPPVELPPELRPKQPQRPRLPGEPGQRPGPLPGDKGAAPRY